MGLMDLKDTITGALGPKMEFKKLGPGGHALTKAALLITRSPDATTKSTWVSPALMPFFLNPTSVTVTKALKVEMLPKVGTGTPEARATTTMPVIVKLDQLVFDTYEERTSVRGKYINELEKCLDYDPKTHHAPTVRLIWGEFSAGASLDKNYQFYIETLDVKYTMFLPNGTPVRAVVSLSLKQAVPEEQLEKKQSPDHAKVYTVRRGDTLQAIAEREYDDPREWRRIANSNKISDPMNLKPGTKLLVPPIIS